MGLNIVHILFRMGKLSVHHEICNRVSAIYPVICNSRNHGNGELPVHMVLNGRALNWLCAKMPYLIWGQKTLLSARRPQ